MSKLFYYIIFILLTVIACKNKQQQITVHEHKDVYTCPMHPEIIRNEPGNCPICGMPLVKKEEGAEEIKDVPLKALLRPTNEYVVSTVSVTTMEQAKEQSPLDALGVIQYDYRQLGTISSRIEGRIEKLYVKYRYQYIGKGDKVMDVYSPELMTSQENYLFVLKHDAGNPSLISATRQRLILLGMSASQIAQITKTVKPLYRVTVYSNYSGFVNDVNATPSSLQNNSMNETNPLRMPTASTKELLVKEGMYVAKGQPLFSIINSNKAIVLLNIFAGQQKQVKVGTPVKITPETAPAKSFAGKINFIQPFYSKESKTLTARVYFDNSALRLPIGSQVQAKIFANGQTGYWLPQSAVLTLGLNKIVFKKEDAGFRAHKVETGIKQNGKVQIVGGLTTKDSVATNAQFLVGSESFIQVKE